MKDESLETSVGLHWFFWFFCFFSVSIHKESLLPWPALQ